jgi:LPXTG-motif cell wall-anchored protein
VTLGATTTVNENGEEKEVPVESTIEIDGTTYTVGHEALNIENNSGVELPSTGGVGTMMMITFGTLVAIAFAVLLITQKKMSVYHD